MSKASYKFTPENCAEWRKNERINPITKRAMNPDTKNGVFAMLKHQCNSNDEILANDYKMKVMEFSKKSGKTRTKPKTIDLATHNSLLSTQMDQLRKLATDFDIATTTLNINKYTISITTKMDFEMVRLCCMIDCDIGIESSNVYWLTDKIWVKRDDHDDYYDGKGERVKDTVVHKHEILNFNLSALKVSAIEAFLSHLPESSTKLESVKVKYYFNENEALQKKFLKKACMTMKKAVEINKRIAKLVDRYVTSVCLNRSL